MVCEFVLLFIFAFLFVLQPTPNRLLFANPPARLKSHTTPPQSDQTATEPERAQTAHRHQQQQLRGRDTPDHTRSDHTGTRSQGREAATKGKEERDSSGAASCLGPASLPPRLAHLRTGRTAEERAQLQAQVVRGGRAGALPPAGRRVCAVRRSSRTRADPNFKFRLVPFPSHPPRLLCPLSACSASRRVCAI